MPNTVVTIAVVGVALIGTMMGPGFAVAQQSDARTIDSCTTITEPGVYTLGGDITNTTADTCIRVTSSDVVLDGGDHTISGGGDGEAVEIHATGEDSQEGIENVTVRNLTIEEWRTGVQFLDVQNATVTGTSIDTVVGVEVGRAADQVTIRDNVISTEGYENRRAGSSRGNGVLLRSSATVVDNRIADGSYGVRIANSANNTIVGNTIATNVAGISVRVVDSVPEETNVVRGNDIVRNDNGIRVVATGAKLLVESNNLTNNEYSGVAISDSSVCSAGPEGAELVSIHGNTLAGNEWGVKNLNQDVVNATGNYWGASDGPSSLTIPATDPLEEPLDDPVTGTLADGNGSAVSDGWDRDGQSNVQFDPWLQQPPDNAGVENGTAS